MAAPFNIVPSLPLNSGTLICISPEELLPPLHPARPRQIIKNLLPPRVDYNVSVEQ